ncbi:MXAN_6230/SCO0854 family RING domain-containing protein [Streptomyces atacamensis]|uniref:MXAN_6230/SCO0854 family RING domain-containing protein n=1 Tax=Streptomyces atacamensis TaxID=531966 RepID=UPI00399C966B
MAATRTGDRTRVTTNTAAEDLEGLLLRRLSTVYVGAPADGGQAGPGVNADGLTALEADLAGRGYVLTAPLRSALAALPPAGLAEHGIRLLGRIDALLGADRRHEPLFRHFPDSVPDHAHSLYSERVLSFLLAQPHQPCVVCGRTGDIGALAPCAHLVCSECLRDTTRLCGCEGGADFFAPCCPLCLTTVTDRANPYLDPAASRPDSGAPAGARKRSAGREDAPASTSADASLRPLRLGEKTGVRVAARAVLADLLARRTPLSPQDREDLAALLPHADPGLDWLPEDIPVRETRAAVLAALLRAPETAASAREVLRDRLDTATDVLRLMWAYSGGEPDLLEPPRLRSLPRPLRRELLGVLDALPPGPVAEDMLRRPEAWKRAGEVLHPFEYRNRFPRAAVAFAAVRGTDLAAARAEWLLEAAAALPGDRTRLVAGRPGGAVRLAVRTFASEAEELLARGDTGGATELLLHRPGELVRRLHRLLRVHSMWNAGDENAPGLPPGLLDGLPAALRRVGPGPLLGAWGRLRVPHEAGERRVFFPRGAIALAHGVDDHAPPVPRAAAAAVCVPLEAELMLRARESTGEPAGVSVLDAALTDLAVPFTERAASRSLVALPRGSRRPLPATGRLRLFLHWTEMRGQRVDLDLSVALYDAQWRFVGLCDYTRLVFGARAAVHSGDFTSAPPPHGATEFVDLDTPALARAGARYAVVVVFSYNDVPFEDLADAFAGFMPLAERGREHGGSPGRAYDPRQVRQRFDLVGSARVCVPMVLDLQERGSLWTDANLSAAGGLHNVYRHRDRLGRLASDLTAHFASGTRATVWDLAVRLAAAASPRVWVRSADGLSLDHYRIGEWESAEGFATRIAEGYPDERHTGTPARNARLLAESTGADVRFAALVDGDVPARWENCLLYRLFPGPLDAGLGPDARLLAASDLLARFAPAEE